MALNACKYRLPRSLLAVEGPKSSTLLNAILPRRVPPVDDPLGYYTVMLNSQGFFLADIFVYPVASTSDSPLKQILAPNSYLIDCMSTHTDFVINHMTRYRIGRKPAIRPIDGYAVWNLFSPDSPPPLSNDMLIALDDRAPDMGYRIVAENTAEVLPDLREEALESYTVRRIVNGVTEDVPMLDQRTLSSDINVDLMGGIEPDRGCYLGQELVTRVLHKNAIKKRTFPVQFYHSNDPQPTNIAFDSQALIPPPLGTPIQFIPDQPTARPPKFWGSVLTTAGNIGLATLRLNAALTPGKLFCSWDDHTGTNTLLLKPFVPEWWAEIHPLEPTPLTQQPRSSSESYFE
ncbi:hypothetical protein CANCADRAFT_45260 [Tortispora caseinolytica NRRL Y-17796]|uniref:CAF17 C-terminal domain-containing protein n=1 Tax=Tortispora caseinolytica NRRL Y-17796 TaxID=767744 RepID=A0A1E4TAG5_9ASCO|nr:hypothetical protein CANCADRAFT_45260 [Tortispora caseinolytica NRRL Y-17796]